MAVDGLTNREIAQILYLSIKTVEMHLGRSYRKLAIGTRGELSPRPDRRRPMNSPAPVCVTSSTTRSPALPRITAVLPASSAPSSRCRPVPRTGRGLPDTAVVAAQPPDCVKHVDVPITRDGQLGAGRSDGPNPGPVAHATGEAGLQPDTQLGTVAVTAGQRRRRAPEPSGDVVHQVGVTSSRSRRWAG